MTEVIVAQSAPSSRMVTFKRCVKGSLDNITINLDRMTFVSAQESRLCFRFDHERSIAVDFATKVECTAAYEWLCRNYCTSYG
jgi:hypothetical protein